MSKIKYDTNICRKVELLLIKSLDIVQLKVEAHTELHKKHKGFIVGKFHIKIIIAATDFKDKNILEKHRLIYECLGDMLQTEIHSLNIKLI